MNQRYVGLLSIFISIFLDLNDNIVTHANEICQWDYNQYRDESIPEVYYINLDKSYDRKITMEKHLNDVGLKYFRVSGLTPNQFYIPQGIHFINFLISYEVIFIFQILRLLGVQLGVKLKQVKRYRQRKRLLSLE